MQCSVHCHGHLISSCLSMLSTSISMPFSILVGPNFRCLRSCQCAYLSKAIRTTHWHWYNHYYSSTSRNSHCSCLLHAFYPFFSSNPESALGRRVPLQQWQILPSRRSLSSPPHRPMCDLLFLVLFQTMFFHRFAAASSFCRDMFPLFDGVRCV